MTTDFLKDKNLLALYPADDRVFPARFLPLRPYFNSVKLLNYADACHKEGITGTQDRILRLVEEGKIGLVLCCPFASDFQLSVQFYAALREKTRLVFWFADDATYFESHSRYYAQAADGVITSDPLAVDAYKRLEIPSMVCRELTAGNKYYPVEVKKDIDVCFIGDLRKRGRREYLDFLRAAGIAVEVFGQGSQNGYLPPEKLSEYFCRSRINLNFSRIGAPDWINRDEPLLGRVRQNTARVREIAAAGAFCLSEYSPAIETVFENGREIDCFRDERELLEKVKRYLADGERREAMAKAAHKRVLDSYTEEVFIRGMMEELTALLQAPCASRGPLYLGRSFKAKEINSLTFSMYIMAKNRKFSAALEAFRLLFKYGPFVFLPGFYGGTLRAVRNLLGKLGR